MNPIVVQYAPYPAAGGAAADNIGPIYLVYGFVSVALTIWLAVVLFRNGRTFLHDVFEDRIEMGEAVNRLLVVGFFMLNLGYAFLLLRAEPTTSNEEAIRQLVNRLGLLLVSLGLIHFVNMAVFWKIRRRAHMDQLPPPVPPQAVLRPTPPPPPPAYHQAAHDEPTYDDRYEREGPAANDDYVEGWGWQRDRVG